LKKAVIYCTTNKINGKKYIGSHNGNKSSYLGSGVNLKKAVKKYGQENFTKQILWEGDEEFRYEMEEYWIAYFDAANNQMFYNVTEKGVGRVKGFKMSAESIAQRISNTDFSWAKNVDWDAKNKKIDWVASSKKRVANTDYKNRDQSWVNNIDWKQIHNNRNFDYSSRSKKMIKSINQYDLQGNFIKEWESCKAAKEAGFTGVTGVLSGKHETCKGFIFRYNNHKEK